MADVSYNIPDLRPGEVFRVEQTIKRSRFIASVGHTPDVEEAKAFIVSAQAMTASLTEPPDAPC